MENNFTPELINNFLKIKIQQVVDASKRTIYPYAGIVLFSFILGSHVYILHYGWTKHQMADIDKTITLAENGKNSASNSSRINRYHFGLSSKDNASRFILSNYFENSIALIDFDSFLKTDSIFLANVDTLNVLEKARLKNEKHLKDKTIDSAKYKIISTLIKDYKFNLNEIRAQYNIENECLQVLKSERHFLIQQKSREHIIEIPIIGIYMNLGDLGILGQIAIIVLLIFYYACIRRELHAINEFVLFINEKKKRYLMFCEPTFSAAQYYLAYESFSQYFVFISSTKRLKLGLFNTFFIFFPSIIMLISLLADISDLISHYETVKNGQNYIFRIGAQTFFSILIFRFNYQNFNLQRRVTNTLRAFGDSVKGYIGDNRFQNCNSTIIYNDKLRVTNGIVEISKNSNSDSSSPAYKIVSINTEEDRNKILALVSEANQEELFVYNLKISNIESSSE
ncbi:MAG: hypothetical protein DHS20C18_54210 [Saprospiraceae bacterium]|nr:MAG: hypothetical protein DHS20C18_54210 [Saprospiraceae bacterium]